MNTPDKEAALLLSLEVEKLSKEAKLPFMLIVHCPDSGEWIRSCNSIKNNPEAAEVFEAVAVEYLNKFKR